VKKSQKSDLVHDINSSMAALLGAVELLNEHWKNDSELVQKIIPAAIDKLEILSDQITLFHDDSNKF
jgi:nitrogen-specific signal transduction histidine kinase